MSAPVFLAIALGLVAVCLVAIYRETRHDELGVPDQHGDYPAIPPDLIEKARLDARLRELTFHETTTGNGKGL
jgi:hypothetical protein